MFSLNDSMRYWLYTEPTDMRKSFHTLSGLVRDRMGRNPLDGDVYIFINRHCNRMKLLHWEPGGLVLYAKMLERGTFGRPSGLQADGSLAWRDLVMVVDGIMADGANLANALTVYVARPEKSNSGCKNICGACLFTCITR